jgi:hypothetical protein
MTNSKYAAFVALDPFFDIVMQGLAGAVNGDPRRSSSLLKNPSLKALYRDSLFITNRRG